MPSNYQVVDFEDYRILALTDGDYISSHLLDGCDWANEQYQIANLLTQDAPNPLIIDVGANLGAFAIKTAANLRDRGLVVAFEPQPMIYYYLCASIVLNKLENVRAINMALSDNDGTAKVPTSGAGEGCNHGAISLLAEVNEMRGWNCGAPSKLFAEVPALQLDNINLPTKADFLKIDVEGFESQVLRGAKGTLEHSNWPPIVIEIWQDGMLSDYREQVEKALSSFGYKLLRLSGDDFLAQHPRHDVKVELQQASSGCEQKLVRVR